MSKKNKYENIIIVLFQVDNDKVKIACACKDTNIKANSLMKEIAPILNARGGGKDSFATAGGGSPTKMDDAKIEAMKYIENNS